MTNSFLQYYAKSDGVTTLEMHTEHVITAGRNLLNKLPFTEEERVYFGNKLFRCAVLHDLGKIHIEFQKRLREEDCKPIRHEIISLWFCENYLNLPDDEAFAIATHHKGIVPHLHGYGRLNRDILTTDMRFHYEAEKDLLSMETLVEWLELMQLSLDIKMEPNATNIEKEISKKFKKVLHHSHQKKVIPDPTKRKELSLMRALLIAADHIGSARMENEIPDYKKIILQDFQPQRDGIFLDFRDFQKELLSISSDIILHAPTGSGKTEAALSWVSANQTDNARLFYLLPYTASVNAMVNRLQKVFGPDKVTAVHSKTLDFFYEQLSTETSNTEKDYKSIEQTARSKKSLSKELFYPVKVSTLHQILKTALKGKGWELALYDYKNALFIIDEFHTYDALLTGMLLASIKIFRKLFNAKFLFMSATIPDFMINYIVNEVFEGDYSKMVRPNPEAESDRIILNRKRHQLYCQFDTSVDQKAELIKKYLANNYSVLIIVNNVKTAQKLYNDIRFSGITKLLHSGFNKKDRNEIEKLITHEDISKRPQLLIATQAVEVSLDIDYDIAFIENAPIDALIQRFGRVNRNGKKKIFPIDRTVDVHYDTVPIYLFENIIGKTPFYNEEVLSDTWEFISKMDNRELSENDLINICNQVYVNGYNETQLTDFRQGLNHSTIVNFETDWVAGHWEDWIEDVIENSNQKIEVLCSNLMQEFEDCMRDKKYIEANQLLVPVYKYEVVPYVKHDKYNVIIADNLIYNNLTGYKKREDSFEEISF